MGYKHSRDDILLGAVALATADGLSTLTFGRLAKHLGTSDRVVVYYFPTKDDLLTAVLEALGVQLQSALAATLTQRAASHRELVRIAWPILARPEADTVFALFFEALGLAASGREPYRSVTAAFVEAWVAWTSEYLSGTTSQRRAEAEATLAVLDGLLLLRQVAGPEAAERAARRVGASGDVTARVRASRGPTRRS